MKKTLIIGCGFFFASIIVSVLLSIAYIHYYNNNSKTNIDLNDIEAGEIKALGCISTKKNVNVGLWLEFPEDGKRIGANSEGLLFHDGDNDSPSTLIPDGSRVVTEHMLRIYLNNE